MKHCFIYIILLILLSCKSQHFSAITLLRPDNIKVIVTNEKGDSIGYLINDIEQDYYSLINLLEISDSIAHIQATVLFRDTTYINGYINLKYIGINPNSHNPIPLYKYPNENSPIISKIIHPQWGDKYNVTNFSKNNWLFIELNEDGVLKKGWLSPNNQCTNPLTTCP